jgi:ADP-ribose pyrophosphatase YjhB (NUDIX family)
MDLLGLTDGAHVLAGRLDAHRRKGTLNRLPFPPGILARGPWPPGRVSGRWSERDYEPPPEQAQAADAAIAALLDRGSPAHDGVAARLAGFQAADGELRLELQRMRWALRLLNGASGALSVLCVVRDEQGRWLAGRRAGWVATWAGMWALGAGGAVDAGEDPARALGRELEEEWGVVPERLAVEALIATPNDMAMLVGQAWLAPGAEVRRDPEHDAHAWWPADPAHWPHYVHPQIRRLGELLA